MTVLEQLPARVDVLALEVSQLRQEMRAEFSAARDEIRAGDEKTHRLIDTRADEVMSQARMLYEDLKATIKLFGNGRS